MARLRFPSSCLQCGGAYSREMHVHKSRRFGEPSNPEPPPDLQRRKKRGKRRRPFPSQRNAQRRAAGIPTKTPQLRDNFNGPHLRLRATGKEGKRAQARGRRKCQAGAGWTKIVDGALRREPPSVCFCGSALCPVGSD